MGRQEIVRKAKDAIAANLSDTKLTFNKHIDEARSKIPGFAEIDRQINSIGPKIMATVLGHNPSLTVESLQKEYDQLVRRKRLLLVANNYPEDYCDIKYHCDKCGDTGYCGIEICDCLKQEIIKASLEDNGLYLLTKDQNFDTFSLEYYKDQGLEYMKRNLEILHEFVDSFVPGRSQSILFMGGTGLGKTHLSSALAKAIIEKGYFVTYVSAIELFNDYEMVQFNRRDSDGIELSKYIEADLLIIDDLGCEMTTNFTVQTIYNIINQRILYHRSTIISTNLNQDDIKKRYSDRVLSRIFGEYKVMVFKGTDVREQKIGK